MPLELGKHYHELRGYINSAHANECPFCGYDVTIHDREPGAFKWSAGVNGYLARVSCDDTNCGEEWFDVFRLSAVVYLDEVVEKKPQ